MIDKAKALAGHSILTGASAGELIVKFLGSIEILLDEVTEDLTKPSVSIIIVNEKLISAISILQSALLDAYYIFFKPCEISGDIQTLDGLLSRFQIQLCEEITSSMKSLLRTSHTKHGYENFVTLDDGSFDLKAFLTDEQSRSSKTSLRGKLLPIYVRNFHVLSHLLLIYICKLHWN